MSQSGARVLALAAAVAALALGACSSSGDSGTGSAAPSQPVGSSTTAGTSSQGSGPETSAATGEPISLGFVNQEKGATVTFTDQRVAAEAAVKLVNERGGINGRPLKLVECATDGSPESSQACANKMVQAKVAIVQSGTDFGDTASIPILTAANIVYVPTLPFQPAHFSTSGVFTFFGGSPAETSAEVQTVLAHGSKKVAMLVLNVPPAISTAKELIQAPLKAQGVEVDIVTFDSTTADFVPTLTAATQKHPDEMIVFTSGPQCGQVMQAFGSLGVHLPVQYPSDCLNKDYLAVGGAGAEGALFMMETLLPSIHEDDAGVSLYRDAMKRFAGKNADELTNSHQVAFIATYDIAQVLSTVKGDITGSSVKAAFLAAKKQPNLMAQPYSCDGSVLKQFKSICNAGVMVVERKGEGFDEPTGQWLSPASS